MQVKNSLNYVNFPRVGEINRMPSMTVPDQTLTIRDIIKRYVNGIPITGNSNVIYDGEDDVLDGVDPRTLDLAEVHELREQLRDLQMQNKAKADVKLAKRQAAELDAEIERRVKQMSEDANASDKKVSLNPTP